MKRIFLYLFSIIFLFSTQLNAIEKKKLTDTEWNEKINTLKWYNEDGKNTSIKIPGSNANLKIYENELYLLGQDIDQYDWWAYGRTEGMDAIRVFGDNYSYTITKPENNGYVKIDDWSDVSPEELIQGLRDANTDQGDGLSYAKQINWIYKPSLDKEKNLVTYSYKVIWNNDSTSMESKNIILGREGYIDQTFVFGDLSDTRKNADLAKSASLDTSFTEGYTYKDYKSGDKIAAAGIGALVATSLGVKALKSSGGAAAAGGILLLLKKFWWILLAPLAFLGKLFGGGDNEQSNNTSKPKRRAKKKDD
ncbi:DUF2167 domain-containing protein [Candidatus Pelagibacter communis]|uniref:DUF2167 domain-containing protein n=1 Tax=Pelagibacter ubique TaxID=198252 RepID=UPI00092CEF4D|nr:DUF2167 domain-containing protein [Candidatus Pelagibacter ubique]